MTYCLRPESAGRKFVEAIRPGDDDYFVLKPMHSAFFQTPLEILLRYLNPQMQVVRVGLAESWRSGLSVVLRQ